MQFREDIVLQKRKQKVNITLAEEDVLGGKRASQEFLDFIFLISLRFLSRLSHTWDRIVVPPALAARRDGTGHMHILPIAVSLAV